MTITWNKILGFKEEFYNILFNNKFIKIIRESCEQTEADIYTLISKFRLYLSNNSDLKHESFP